MKTQHVAVYARVSSDDQKFAAQQPDLEARAEVFRAMGKTVVWYFDKFTGRKTSRPGWSKLWGAVERGEVEAIVVWRMDRLGRTSSGLTALFDALRAKSVRLISIRDGIEDLDTPTARMIACVLATVAVFETEVRSERQAAGIAAAKKEGVYKGGKPGRRVRVTIEKENAARALFADKKSLTEVQLALGLGRRTVWKLRRRFDAEKLQLVESA